MQDDTRTSGYLLAAMGALVLLVSLWLPWYSFSIPGWVIDRAQQLAGQLGILGPAVRQGAETARHLGTLHFTAWQVLKQIDVVLAIAASAAGALALLALVGRAQGVRPIVIGAGMVALALSGYRAITPPGPDGLLHAAFGVYVAMGAAAAIVAGGALAGPRDARELAGTAVSLAPAPTPRWPGADDPDPAAASEVTRAWSTTGSVAPPGI